MMDACAVTGSGDHQPKAGTFLRPQLTLASALAGAALVLLSAGAQAQSTDIVLLSQTARGFSAEGKSNTPAVNLNGLVTAYSSDALDLVAPPLPTALNQVYARQLDMVTSALVSQGPDGHAGQGASQDNGLSPGISDDGRYVAFFSLAPNLTDDAANGKEQIFVADRVLGLIELISRGTDGMPGNGDSLNPKLSGDARFVVFQSTATNLVAQDTHGVSEIFLFDRLNATMQLVSIAADGTLGDRASITPAISEDGTVAAFASSATTLVSQPIPNGVNQIFVHELRPSGTTQLVSISSDNDGAVAGNKISYFPSLSGNGIQVAFKSEAFNLVPNDTNGVPDVFVRDRSTGMTQRVSVDSHGGQSNGLSGGPGISADGRFVAFPSFASTLVDDDGDGLGDVFVYDRSDGLIMGVTVGKNLQPDDSVSDIPVTISADGRWIGFASAASNLVPNENDPSHNTEAFLACNPFDAFGCAPPTPTPIPPTSTSTPTPTPPTLPPTPTPTPTTPSAKPCVGDCDGDGVVNINELILMVNIALELQPLCPTGGSGGCLAGDANCDCQITVDEIIRAVLNALQGCHDFGSCSLAQEQQMCCEGPIGTPTATPTPTPSGGTPTATPSPSGQLCVGDCSQTGVVQITDLVRMVNIALDLQSVCPDEAGPGCLAGDSNCDCQITVDEIIQAVNNALNGCTIFNTCDPVQHAAMCCGS